MKLKNAGIFSWYCKNALFHHHHHHVFFFFLGGGGGGGGGVKVARNHPWPLLTALKQNTDKKEKENDEFPKAENTCLIML